MNNIINILQKILFLNYLYTKMNYNDIKYYINFKQFFKYIKIILFRSAKKMKIKKIKYLII